MYHDHSRQATAGLNIWNRPLREISRRIAFGFLSCVVQGPTSSHINGSEFCGPEVSR